jgi:LysE type translocator
MFDPHRLLLFFAAALILAITPGPGIFYVLARSLAGGRREGIHSSLGTFVGGLFHVFAAALGVSAILAASAVAFHTVKYAGAAYLVWLGIRMIRTRNAELGVSAATPSRNAFRQGILTEALNPKTALFFPIVHSAIHFRPSGSRLPAIRSTWRNLRHPQHHRRPPRRPARRSTRAKTQAQRPLPQPPASRFGPRHDRPGCLRGIGRHKIVIWLPFARGMWFWRGFEQNWSQGFF